MKNCIGLRRESKDLTERRVPLTPDQVRELIEKYSIRVIVEPSEERIFRDEEFRAAGARISHDLSECNIILGVKEVPLNDLIADKTYCFFSHTFKAQQYNMPMLKRMLELKDSLFDYELVRDENGKRVLFFGDYAGYAGMIDSLWALGQRLLSEGINNPFKNIQQANKYDRFDDAKEAVIEAGRRIAAGELPEELYPLVCGFTGYGHVSKGAQAIFDLMPVELISAGKLPEFFRNGKFSGNTLYKVEFTKPDMFEPEPQNGKIPPFDLEDFRKHPQHYRSKLEQYIPYLTMLVNGIYWERSYPRLITKQFLQRFYSAGETPRLRVIGDITCDPDGSIEAAVKTTNSDNPIYVYEPLTDSVRDGWEGNGPVVLAVDKLPTEIPREASIDFGKALLPFVPQLAAADYSRPVERLDICRPFQNALIAHRGELTPRFTYLHEYVTRI